jgi:hypothetical protein
MRLVAIVNGYEDMKYNYSFKRMYKLAILDEYDDELDTKCTILEFEQDGD